MADELKMQHAKQVYATLCACLDQQSWQYEKDEEKLKISCGIKSKDLPINITIRINPNLLIINVISYVPIEVPEDKRLDLAIAVSTVNYSLINGCFDYNIEEGTIFYRMSNGFAGCEVAPELLAYMINFSAQAIDAYNDRFLAIANGEISIDDFLKARGGK